MLGRRDREAGGVFAVKLFGHDEPGDGVRPEKVDEMRGGADARRFDRGHTAEAKVVQLEAQTARVVGGVAQVRRNHLLLFPRVRRHRRRVPHLHEQRLHEVGQPEALRIGVFYRQEHILHWHHRAFRHGLYLQRQSAAVHSHDVLPTGTVVREPRRKMRRVVLFRLLDLRRRHHFPDEVLLQQVLQPEEAHFTVLAAAALKVRVHHARRRRVLHPVRHLVRVRQQQDVLQR
mmetsp:Transcript_17536/g.53477  ORF Transcript_17536/g.53477 Transcript_17536/m.53477 type:complete len:231 (-) Transcript_17536:76-768(-)